MDWMYLFYFSLAVLIFFGAKGAGKGKWNEGCTSLKQTKILQGIAALGVALHHMAQKSCASWHPRQYIVHGLDPFVPMGYMLVAVFLFCSGLGLYKSLHTKPDYLKGFFRRRILPMIIAFYLSEIVYTIVRLAMGEKMDALTILWYLSGLHMANPNAWYIVVIPFFYLVFWAAFRLCRREGTAIFWVFLFTLGYTVLGACIDHQNDWWMRGEWWYNSILLFPIGLLFGKFEGRVLRFLKKGYWVWLILAFAGIFLLYQQSEWLLNNRLGYYDAWNSPMKIPHRLLSAGTQWLVSLFFVAFCFLLMMKVTLGNGALAWLGAMSLDFYLIHGMFVEMFGYNFLDLAKSIVYIRNVPIYIVAVLGCSVPATALFNLIRKKITGLALGKRRKNGNERNTGAGMPGPGQGEAPGIIGNGTPGNPPKKERRGIKTTVGSGRFRRFITPGLLLILLTGFFIFLHATRENPNIRSMGGLEIRVPEGFTLIHGDTREAIWQYTEKDRKAGYLILTSGIPDAAERSQDTLERLSEEGEWLTEKELYINPQGIRMLRGFVDYADVPERRYYIERTGGLLVMRMTEDERYYHTADCEQVLLETADSIRRK